MTAVTDLALRARETLATSGGGALHIQGVGRIDARSADVLLYDDEGQPTFLCEPDSPVTLAARTGRAAVLSVLPHHTCDDLTGVILAGHLAIVGTENVDGVDVSVIGLRVCSVHVERDDPLAVSVVQCEIPLDAYRASSPDLVAQAAHRIVRHTNSSHAAELRTFVAGIRGVQVGDIVAAELDFLELTGVDLRWMDGRGAHAVRVVFPVPARDPQSLAACLRETLMSGRS